MITTKTIMITNSLNIKLTVKKEKQSSIRINEKVSHSRNGRKAYNTKEDKPLGKNLRRT